MTEVVIENQVNEVVIEDGSTIVELVIQEEVVEVVEVGTPGVPGPQGEQGEQGEPGPATNSSYHHVQGMSAAVWTIAHNLNFFPNVTAVDSAGTEVEGEVVYIDANNITITFSSAFSGEAYLS